MGGERRRGGRCKDGQLAAIQRHAQACSQTATSRANTALHNLKEEEDVENEVHAILCSALNRIRTHCLRKLTRCFNPGDVLSMVEGQVDEMRTYLTRLAGNRLGSEQLDACHLDIGNQEEMEELYGEDGTHHFAFYDVADKEVGTHSFTFDPIGKTISNSTPIEVIDIREGEHGEELQEWLWGGVEVEKETKLKLERAIIWQEEMDSDFSIQSGSPLSLGPSLAVIMVL